MKILLDMNLPPALGDILIEQGHEVVRGGRARSSFH